MLGTQTVIYPLPPLPWPFDWCHGDPGSEDIKPVGGISPGGGSIYPIFIEKVI